MCVCWVGGGGRYRWGGGGWPDKVRVGGGEAGVVRVGGGRPGEVRVKGGMDQVRCRFGACVRVPQVFQHRGLGNRA